MIPHRGTAHIEGLLPAHQEDGPQQSEKLSCIGGCHRRDLSLLRGLIVLVHGAGLSKILRGEATSSRPKFEGCAKLGKPNEAHRKTLGRSMCREYLFGG